MKLRYTPGAICDLELITEPYPVTIQIGTFILSWEPITGSFFPDGKNTKKYSKTTNC